MRRRSCTLIAGHTCALLCETRATSLQGGGKPCIACARHLLCGVPGAAVASAARNTTARTSAARGRSTVETTVPRITAAWSGLRRASRARPASGATGARSACIGTRERAERGRRVARRTRACDSLRGAASAAPPGGAHSAVPGRAIAQRGCHRGRRVPRSTRAQSGLCASALARLAEPADRARTRRQCGPWRDRCITPGASARGWLSRASGAPRACWARNAATGR